MTNDVRNPGRPCVSRRAALAVLSAFLLVASSPIVHAQNLPGAGDAQSAGAPRQPEAAPGPVNSPQSDPSTQPNPQQAGGRPAQPDPARDDALSLIGLQLFQVIGRFGAPSEVYPIRGESAWQDDVVFYYSNHLYFYWYDNRVWQIRFDRYFEGAFLGLSMGSSITAVEKLLGAPVYSKDNWAVFQLPDRGFPVRARLYFRDGALDDAYIYRSDF